MNTKEDLVIISNERIINKNNNFYCSNIDIKSIAEGLNDHFNVMLLSRKSKNSGNHKIVGLKAKTAANILEFLINVAKNFRNKKTKYLIISITPYTFFAAAILFFFRKKKFLYLRSNGYEEYKEILGFFGPFIYHLMYSFATIKSNLIVCQAKLAKKKPHKLVFPSQLDVKWLSNLKKEVSLDKPRLLYVGRIKVEKGINSLFEMYEKLKNEIDLSIVGDFKNFDISNKKINFLGYKSEQKELINIFDNNNIFILPSFTEAHPQVLFESLARLRPVIIFDEISHVVKDFKGVIISKRNSQSLLKAINFVIDNYNNIQDDMKNNKLPTKDNFISAMIKILN